jgi:hypothetical protein
MGTGFKGASAYETTPRADIGWGGQVGLQESLRLHTSTLDSWRQTEASPGSLTPRYKYRTRASP